jgi:WD40 repeat protein
MGVQVGEGNTQIIYTYNRLTWTDGVAPPPLVSVSGVIDSPYRGLSAFEEQDAAFFFGREAAATELLNRMSRHLLGAGLLVVSGVSGAGKSSLLQAGVLPRIRGAGLAFAPGAARWPCLVFTPTRSPLDELALRVAVLAGADAAAVRRGLDADPAGFALTARQAALAPPPGPGSDPAGPAAGPHPLPRSRQPRLLLVIDQFEQVFTQCLEEGQRQAFITALCAAASAGPGPDDAPAALVVLGVRADFEARCADYPQLAGAVQDRYLVTAMTGRQLRMAITEPAKTAGSRVEDDLTEVLLAEVHTRQPGVVGAGALPLLSHALDQAWRSRTGQALTLADYERTGGIEGAVADSAQRAYDQLTPGQQAAARQIFTRLTATSSDGVDTADRATRAELTHGKNPDEMRDVEAVLEAFAAERLLTLAADSVAISHEVLLTAWPLLRDTWLAETHADRVVRTRLHNVAAEWARGSRDPSYLYSGNLLEAATGTAARIGADPARNPPLSQTERDFLHASDHAHHRTTRRRRAVIAGLLALTMTAITAAGIAVHNAANATRQHAIALSRQLALQSLSIDPTDPVTARQLAVAAWRVSPTDQADSAMTTLLAEQQQQGILPADPSGVNGVAFSPDGKLLATADADSTVRLWDPVTGQAVRTIRANTGSIFLSLGGGTVNYGVLGVEFSPDGKLLASADSDGTVRLWNPATGQAVRTIRVTGTGSLMNGMAISPDSKLLAASFNGTVRLWDPATGQAVRTIHDSDANLVNELAFSPNGKLLAGARDDGTVRLWDPATGQAVRTIKVASRDSIVSAVAFSPDGRLLADVWGGTVRLWNPATGRPVSTIQATGLGFGVNEVVFSPDGKLLASADDDGTVRLWNPATGQAVRTIRADTTSPGGGVVGVAFSPDGRLASADSDGTVRLWNPATGQPVSASIQATSGGFGVVGVAFSPDGKLLASADSAGTVRLWNPATGRAVRTIRAGTTSFNGGLGEVVVFSPDGKLLASADDDGTVRLWDPTTGQPVRAPIQATSRHFSVAGVAFSPDGRLLASADGDGTVRLWDPATSQAIRTIQITGPDSINGVVFSPRGRLLATTAIEGVRLWDRVTGRAVRTVEATPKGGVSAAAFSPDGKLLASAHDRIVRLRNPVTGQAVRTIRADITSPDVSVTAVAFSPDGKLLVGAASDGMVRLWDPVTGQDISTIRAGTTSPNGGVNKVAFSPDGKLLASAGGDGTVRLWRMPLFTHPYEALCTDVGPPARQDWNQYVPGEPQPKVCT